MKTTVDYNKPDEGKIAAAVCSAWRELPVPLVVGHVPSVVYIVGCWENFTGGRKKKDDPELIVIERM